MSIYNKTCPIKFVKSKTQQPRKPWITIEIIEQLRLTNALYVKFMDEQSDESFNPFKTQRNFVDRLRCKAMTEFYNRKFRENKGNIKEIWNVIREYIGGNKKNGNSFVLKFYFV